MVVFLDLDEETSTFPNHVGSGFSARHSYPLGPFSLDHQLEPIQPLENSREEEGLETTNPNLNSCSAALGCYPSVHSTFLILGPSRVFAKARGWDIQKASTNE